MFSMGATSEVELRIVQDTKIEVTAENVDTVDPSLYVSVVQFHATCGPFYAPDDDAGRCSTSRISSPAPSRSEPSDVFMHMYTRHPRFSNPVCAALGTMHENITSRQRSCEVRRQTARQAQSHCADDILGRLRAPDARGPGKPKSVHWACKGGKLLTRADCVTRRLLRISTLRRANTNCIRCNGRLFTSSQQVRQRRSH